MAKKSSSQERAMGLLSSMKMNATKLSMLGKTQSRNMDMGQMNV